MHKMGWNRDPPKKRNTLYDDEILHMLYHAANEPDILQEAENRQNHILDTDNRKIEVYPFVQELEYLAKDEKKHWVRHSKVSQHCLEVDLEC
jgi:hypothetical protein